MSTEGYYAIKNDRSSINERTNRELLGKSSGVCSGHAGKRLNLVVHKYAPQFSCKNLPEAMVNNTGVIEVDIKECTGKYYK